MRREDWIILRNLFRWRYRNEFLTDEGEDARWFNTMILYPDAVVDRAVRYYIEASDIEPTLEMFKAVLEEVGRGRIEAFFKARSDADRRCKRCNDYGYVCAIYPTKVEYVMPCNCQTAKDKFEWMTEDRQMTEPDCMAKFGIHLSELDNRKIRFVRRPRVTGNMTPSSDKPKYTATELSDRVVIYDVFY